MVANKKGQLIQNQVPVNTVGMPITNSPSQRSINNVGYGVSSATPPKVMKTDMDDSVSTFSILLFLLYIACEMLVNLVVLHFWKGPSLTTISL